MIDLYYWTTPNGHKITMFLEEAEVEYRFLPVNIGLGEQFNPAFLELGPNNRIQVILECTEHKESGMPGTSRYITTKNKKNTPDRMELKKYNPILKRMTVHKEIK